MASLKGSRTEQHLKDAFAGESQANRRYLFFAKQADIEGYPEVAGLFRDTAEGETGHAHGHLEYLKKVGDPATGLPVTDVPQMLASADIAAVGAWQPITGQAIKAVPGSRPVYTSADEPGLIYDALAVTPASLKSRRADWQKVVKVWDRVVAYIGDAKTQPDAVKIMAARVGIPPQDYLPLLKGTKLLSLAEARKVYVKGEGFQSLYGSTKVADGFNVANAVYKKAENIDSYIDASFTNAK